MGLAYGGVVKDGQEPVVDGARDAPGHRRLEHARGELECRRLALLDPRLAIGVEGAVSSARRQVPGS